MIVGCRGCPGPAATSGAGPPPVTGSATELGFGTSIVGPAGGLLPVSCAMAAPRLPRTITGIASHCITLVIIASRRRAATLSNLPCEFRYFDPSQQGVIMTALL